MDRDPAPGGASSTHTGVLVGMDKTLPPPDAEQAETERCRRSPRGRSMPWNIGCRPWCIKYFWEGQMLVGDEEVEEDGDYGASRWGARVLARYRRPLSLLLPALLFHFVWWAVMIRYSFWHLFQTRYSMSITMIFGSVIAGMTSEGGGAVAFPVMTLVLGVAPSVARDFSICIQACGMSAAAFTVLFMRVQVEWNSLILCTLGGGLGLILGLEFVDPLLSPPQKKIGFVSIWFSFAVALFLLNRYHKRKTYRTVPHLKAWKVLVLFLAGVFGGMFTSFAGSGLDICSFSILTLLFRVSEKTATPTSVILMGVNSVVGAFWRIIMMANVADETYEYLAVCVPLVVLGAPLGSVIGSHFHRQVLALLVYILDLVSLVTAFALVPLTPSLIGMSVGLIVGGGVFFLVITWLGHMMMKKSIQETEEDTKPEHKATNGIQNGGFVTKLTDTADIKVAHL